MQIFFEGPKSNIWRHLSINFPCHTVTDNYCLIMLNSTCNGDNIFLQSFLFKWSISILRSRQIILQAPIQAGNVIYIHEHRKGRGTITFTFDNSKSQVAWKNRLPKQKVDTRRKCLMTFHSFRNHDILVIRKQTQEYVTNPLGKRKYKTMFYKLPAAGVLKILFVI